MSIVAPSVLSIDFSKLETQMKELNESGAEYIHFDVMDGHFVPNLTFGPDILKGMKKVSSLFMDVHLMVSDPAYYADVFVKAGAQNVTFHVEAIDKKNGLALVRHLHEQNVEAGITLKPATAIETLLPYLDQVELVLVMSVNPGFGGQSFMEDQLEKVRFLKTYREQHHLNYKIEIDGGINANTCHKALEAGCDILVAGSYVFKHESMKEAVASLR